MKRELEIARDLRETAGLLLVTKYVSKVTLLEEAATIIEDLVTQPQLLPEVQLAEEPYPEVEITHTEVEVDIPEVSGDVTLGDDDE